MHGMAGKLREPAEVAYFAQTAESYRVLGRPATPILHRASLTVVERRTARTLMRYGLKLEDFFGKFVAGKHQDRQGRQ